MTDHHPLPTRRRLLALAGAGLVLGVLPPGHGPARSATPDSTPVIRRPIPGHAQSIPVIGMGTWITFNVGRDAQARAQRTQVLRAFLDAGGQMIDSSPMYGSAEAVIGHALEAIGGSPEVFTASKVWTPDGDATREQIERSARHWGIRQFDLMQVHNLVAWEAHLETLFAMRAAGKLKYVGITTSHGRRHDAVERIMRDYPIDFVQASYNLANRRAEDRLLPLAAERGIAFIANRPFQGGRLIERAKRHALPGWAAEAGMDNWAEFLLKFIVSHPAVTCSIPATSRVDHMQENMGALRGELPDPGLRRRMIRQLKQL